jgi:hypothetical protein
MLPPSSRETCGFRWQRCKRIANVETANRMSLRDLAAQILQNVPWGNVALMMRKETVMPNFEDRDRKSARRDEPQREPKHEEGRQSPGQDTGTGGRSYGSPSSGQKPGSEPSSSRDKSRGQESGNPRRSPDMSDEE